MPLLGELGRHLTQCSLGRGLPPYEGASIGSSIRLVRVDMGRKLGAAVPLFGEGELGPHLTRQVSSRSIQPFGHNTPMSRTGKDNGPIAELTVLQTVAPKRFALCYRAVVGVSGCDVGVLWPNG